MAATNVTRLNSAISQLEDLHAEFSQYKAENDNKISVLRALIKKNTGMVQELQERVEFLEGELNVVEDGDLADLTLLPSRAVTVESGTGDDTRQLEPVEDEKNEDEDEAAIIASEEAKKSKPIKDLVNKTFQQLMGVERLMGKQLPEYPYGIDKTHRTWPKDSATGQPLLRFDWSQTKNKNTTLGLDEVFKNIREFGSQRLPIAKKFLDQISDDDLREKIKKKYLYMAGEFRKMKTAEEKEETQRRRREEELDDAAQEEEDRDALTRAKKNSRAEAMLSQRKRKRPLSQFADPKYDAAFIINAMSDYEDDPEQDPDLPKVWIRRVPDYRSDILKALYANVDAVRDPDPDKEKAMTTKKDGPPLKNAIPPIARTLENRIRAWQVDSKIHEDNPHWTGRRVASSGKAWGDNEDPTEDDDKGKGKRRAVDQGDGGDQANRKRRRPATSKGKDELAQAAELLQKLVGDKELDAMFDI